MEKQNSALEDRSGELSKRLDTLESKQPGDSGIPDLFADPEDECFSTLPVPLSAVHIASFLKNPCVYPSAYNGPTPWEDYKAQYELVAKINEWDWRTKAASDTAWWSRQNPVYQLHWPGRSRPSQNWPRQSGGWQDKPIATPMPRFPFESWSQKISSSRQWKTQNFIGSSCPS